LPNDASNQQLGKPMPGAPPAPAPGVPPGGPK
jgi:hypothetical protein